VTDTTVVAEAPVIAPLVPDAPKLPEAIPNVTEKAWSEGEPGWARDSKTGRFVTVDKPAEAKQPEPTSATPAVVEPTGGDKQPVEVTDADQKSEDEPSPAQRAAFARMREEMDALRAETHRLAALIPKPEAPKPQPKPSYDAYDSPEAYETALTDWAKAEGAREATQTAEQNRLKSENDAKAQAIVSRWNERLTAFKADHPDYDAVTGKDDLGRELTIPLHIAVAIAEIENGPAVEYHLGKHRDEASRIAGLTPIAGAAEIGRIAAQRAEPVKVALPKPKPSPAPSLGNRTAPDAKDPNDMTTEEYAAANAARLKWNARR